MSLHPTELHMETISAMDREQLIGMILDFNNYSVFQFTGAWLKKQRTARLRALLLSAGHQHCKQDG